MGRSQGDEDIFTGTLKSAVTGKTVGETDGRCRRLAASGPVIRAANG
jgi:hypothetical protein